MRAAEATSGREGGPCTALIVPSDRPLFALFGGSLPSATPPEKAAAAEPEAPAELMIAQRHVDELEARSVVHQGPLHLLGGGGGGGGRR